jgi:pimeloyl-ACP methyl ester carboxylesterase
MSTLPTSPTEAEPAGHDVCATGSADERHVVLIPGFFGFANLGDFTYWGPVQRTLGRMLDEAGMPACIHCVKTLPTSSLRARARRVLDTLAALDADPSARIHLIGHSTGGLDARLLLTPAVALGDDLDCEVLVSRVRSVVTVSTPHHGAPIAAFFTSLLGLELLRLLSIVTMLTLRVGSVPLSALAEVTALLAVPDPLAGRLTGSLAGQLYEQLLGDFNEERRAQVAELLEEVKRDQSLLAQLAPEPMDVFNAAAGDRPGVRYGSVVTMARQPGFQTFREIGLDAAEQLQHVLYLGLSRLAAGYRYPTPRRAHARALRAELGRVPDADANDGIVPTLSQPWGTPIAVAMADHLDIIGHYAGDDSSERHYDWLTTQSRFDTQGFERVWRRVTDFLRDAESGDCAAARA